MKAKQSPAVKDPDAQERHVANDPAVPDILTVAVTEVVESDGQMSR